MDKKYFFFDIDGTLTNRYTGELKESSIPMIYALKKEGHFVSLATGRAHYKCIDFMKLVGLSHMVCNGGNALVIDSKLVVNKPLNREKVLNLINQAKTLGYGVLVAYDDSINVISKNDLFLKQAGKRQEPTIYQMDETLEYSHLENIFKLYISILEEKEHLLTFKNTLGHLRYVKEYMMFQEDNKRQGIIDMMRAVEGDLNQVVVFGDDYNDLNMFEEPFYSVAVKNACDELKEKASYVATTDLYEECVKHGWII